MMSRAFAVVLLGFAAVPWLNAQEGFPLDGTWRGEWTRPSGQRETVVIVMEWDGDRINGMINPGPNSVPFSSARLNPADWTVEIKASEPDTIEIEGKLHEIGSYNRYILGSWTINGVEHDFRLTRE